LRLREAIRRVEGMAKKTDSLTTMELPQWAM
jgi:hypothetical protein